MPTMQVPPMGVFLCWTTPAQRLGSVRVAGELLEATAKEGRPVPTEGMAVLFRDDKTLCDLLWDARSEMNRALFAKDLAALQALQASLQAIGLWHSLDCRSIPRKPGELCVGQRAGNMYSFVKMVLTMPTII